MRLGMLHFDDSADVCGDLRRVNVEERWMFETIFLLFSTERSRNICDMGSLFRRERCPFIEAELGFHTTLRLSILGWPFYLNKKLPRLRIKRIFHLSIFYFV